MTMCTVKRMLVLFLVNHFYVGTRYFGRKRKLLNSLGHEIGEDTKIVGPISGTGKLVAGKHCWIGKDLTIHGNGTVILGNCCDLAPDVTFLTGGHEIGTPERRAGTGRTETIRIGDGCWIGARVTLVSTVTVGKGSVVGACACVVKDVPPNTLVGGVPAREIRRLYEAECSGE